MIVVEDKKRGETLEKLNWEVDISKNLGVIRMNEFVVLPKKRFSIGAIDVIGLLLSTATIAATHR